MTVADNEQWQMRTENLDIGQSGGVRLSITCIRRLDLSATQSRGVHSSPDLTSSHQRHPSHPLNLSLVCLSWLITGM